MKKLMMVSLLFGCLMASLTWAEEAQSRSEQPKYLPGRFYLTAIPEDPNGPTPPVASCTPIVELVLDQAKISGNVAFHAEKPAEGCFYITTLPEWHYRMEKPQDAGCGSVRITGTRLTQMGPATIEITDHRTRRCDDVQVGQIVVKETSQNGGTKIYTGQQIYDTLPIDPVICQAHWEGFFYNALTSTCEAGSASGCANPFSYQTIEECRAGHPFEGR